LGESAMDATAKVVEALMRYGPRYSKISRETGVPIPTVRYILTKRFPKLGLSSRAAINCGVLGLQRYLVTLSSRLSPKYMSGLLKVFGEFMYLKYYTYLMKSRRFLTIFTLPPKYVDDLIELLENLKSMGTINDYTVKKLLYMRILPFRVDCFDFRRGVWRQDWFNREFQVPEIYEELSPTVNFDKIDLLILKELQKNIFVKYVDLSRKLGVSRQTIKRHYQHAMKAIYMYAVIWFPIWNPDLVSTSILIESKNVERARQPIINIPFTYAEMRTVNGEYLGLMLVPSMALYRVLKYLSERLIIDNLEFLDMENTLTFAIHSNLFLKKTGWLNPYKISIEKIMKRVNALERNLPDRLSSPSSKG